MTAQASRQDDDRSLRIQKHLAGLGLASRREAERWISEGRIAVNGKKLLEQGCKVDPSRDKITIDGKAIPLTAPPKIYWLFHKPDRTICSTKAQAEDKITIYDLPKIQKVPFKLTFAGRLDYRSEGLMLLSNDGELIQKLTHPSSKVPRSYYVLAKGKLSDEQILQIKRGIKLEDGPVKDVDIKYTHGKNLGQSKGSWYIVTVHEGRNRLVRRIFGHFGLEVNRLIRFAMGPMRLPDSLKPGDYLQLSASQLKELRTSIRRS